MLKIWGEPEARLILGRWATVRIELRAEGALGEAARKELEQSQERQRQVAREIRDRKLAMLHAFYADHTYDYILVHSAPKRPYPTYHEVGTWTFDPALKRVTSKATNQERSSLPEAGVLTLTPSQLIVEMRFSGGSEGIVETIFHQRVREL